MVWLFRTRNLRKYVFLAGAACSGLLLGAMVFHRLLVKTPSSSHHLLPSLLRFPPLSPSSSSSSKQCSTACNGSHSSPSYQQLKTNSMTMTFTDSRAKRLDVVFLGSNSPIEDRFVAGASRSLGASFFSIIDGHKGTQCAQHLQENMLGHIAEHFATGLGKGQDLEVLLDMGKVLEGVGAGGGKGGEKKGEGSVVVAGEGGVSTSGGGVSVEELQNGLKQSLTMLDANIVSAGLEALKVRLSGGVVTPDVTRRIEIALHGACSLTAALRADDIVVANTGDCRAVVGRRGPAGGAGGKVWEPIPISVDQNAQNADEVKRLVATHPGEEMSLVVNGRVLGSLMPFRTFGDADFKWEAAYLKTLPLMVPLEAYKTPPYITAEPVLSRHSLNQSDRFLVLATDGLWERLSNQQVVDVVGQVVSTAEDCKCEVNAAVELLWHALGGQERGVADMLALKAPLSRYYRDDITIMVVHL